MSRHPSQDGCYWNCVHTYTSTRGPCNDSTKVGGLLGDNVMDLHLGICNNSVGDAWLQQGPR